MHVQERELCHQRNDPNFGGDVGDEERREEVGYAAETILGKTV